MLRPNELISWFNARAKKGQNELGQLMDGVLPGGTIVLGGAEANVVRALPILSSQQRIARLQSIQNAKLDVDRPTTFDTAAIVQLILIARNESFHQAVETTLELIQKVIDSGQSIDVALQVARDQAAHVQKL